MPIQWLKLAYLITVTMLVSYPLICQWPIMSNCNRVFQHSYYAEQSRTEISILTTKNKNLHNYTKLQVPYIKSDQCQTKNIKFHVTIQKIKKIFPHLHEWHQLHKKQDTDKYTHHTWPKNTALQFHLRDLLRK
jgi:hypothetical protein